MWRLRQVINSFAILVLITCIYATLFTQLWGGTEMDVNGHFSSFSVSLFTMFQVSGAPPLSPSTSVYASAYLHACMLQARLMAHTGERRERRGTRARCSR